jgi:hypothetical protein
MQRTDIKRRRHFGWAAVLFAACVPALTGCQVDVAGQTLPSPYWLTDDVQYFAPGPEFKLSREAAAMQAAEAEAATGSGGAPAPPVAAAMAPAP